MDIPAGTTHVYPANPLDYKPSPSFFRLKFLRYNSLNEEELQPMYELQYWNSAKGWVKDTSFCDRFKKMMTLAQYLETECQLQ